MSILHSPFSPGKDPAPRARLAATLLPLLLAAAALPAVAQTDLRLFDEVRVAVRRRFHDRERARAWAQACEQARPRAEACRTPEELHALINELLGALKTSHTALIEGDVYRDNLAAEFRGEPTLRAGVELGRFPEGTFVTAVYDGGPAERAGLAVGERVVYVNHLAPEASRAVVDAGSDPGIPGIPHALLRAEEGRTLELRVQAAPGGPTRRVFLQPAPVSLVEATRAGARIVERDGMRLAVLHPWHFMHWGVVRAMREAIEGPLADADGLVLDLRGRGGQVFVLWGALALFTPRQDGARVWNKPAVALIDGSARSAKEVFAWHWKKLGVGPLVGQRTAGAVLGSGFFTLSDGSVLMLPVADVGRLTGGVNLEGVGVEPDVAVDWKIPFCRGRDAILEKGLEALTQAVRGQPPAERLYGLRRPGWEFETGLTAFAN